MDHDRTYTDSVRMLKWIQTANGEYATVSVSGVELARIEITASTWSILGREGTVQEGSVASEAKGRIDAVAALAELLSQALAAVRTDKHASHRPPGWGH